LRKSVASALDEQFRRKGRVGEKPGAVAGKVLETAI
jgi:hypothetical protein